MQLSHARTKYRRWLLATRDLSPHTVRAYDGDIAALASYLGARSRVAGINQDRIIAFLEHQRAAGLSGASLRRRASGLRGFCRWLHARGHLPDDPWTGTVAGAGRSRMLPRVVPARDLNRLPMSSHSLGKNSSIRSSHRPVSQPRSTSFCGLYSAMRLAKRVRSGNFARWCASSQSGELSALPVELRQVGTDNP